eukprot:1957085-Karenia_brevis.AAC.1
MLNVSLANTFISALLSGLACGRDMPMSSTAGQGWPQGCGEVFTRYIEAYKPAALRGRSGLPQQ